MRIDTNCVCWQDSVDRIISFHEVEGLEPKTSHHMRVCWIMYFPRWSVAIGAVTRGAYMEMTDAERLRLIYSALQERGYAPINQIVGFLLTGDPTYITNHNGARSLAGRINRSELLSEIVADYIQALAGNKD